MTARPPRSIDIESLVRDALSHVAVSAFARRIDLVVHIDHRLPGRAIGDPAALGEFLRRGLAHMIEAGRIEKIALALWREEAEGAGPAVLLEVGRTRGTEGRHATPLADLWRIPLGDGMAAPRPHRRDARAETVMVPLPCTPAPDAPPLGARWRETFAGRYALQVRELVCDPARFAASCRALGLESEVAPDPAAALALARARVAAGRPVEFLLVDAHPFASTAVELARRFRGDPNLAGVAIVLAGSHRAPGLSGADMALFDAAPSISVPWRRLFEVLGELAEARAGKGGPPPEIAARAGSVPSLAGRRILIAEDVATNQVLLRAMLEPTGAAIEAVPDGVAVLDRHAAEPADLVIMDLQMPRMGGILAAERIRALAGRAGRVPILALTAHAADADRGRALAAGMDAFLAKPVVVAEFYDLVCRLLAPDPGGR